MLAPEPVVSGVNADEPASKDTSFGGSIGAGSLHIEGQGWSSTRRARSAPFAAASTPRA